MYMAIDRHIVQAGKLINHGYAGRLIRSCSVDVYADWLYPCNARDQSSRFLEEHTTLHAPAGPLGHEHKHDKTRVAHSQTHTYFSYLLFTTIN